MKVFKLLEINLNHHFLQWSGMDAFGAKPFSQLRYPEILHSGPKHIFTSFLQYEGFRTAQKQSKPSFFVQWSRMDAFGPKPFSLLRYPDILR
jgi:hypothetical protein